MLVDHYPTKHGMYGLIEGKKLSTFSLNLIVDLKLIVGGKVLKSMLWVYIEQRQQ